MATKYTWFSYSDVVYAGEVYEYKGWTLQSRLDRVTGLYSEVSQGFHCYTKSKRNIKLKRAFRLWVNSLPELAFSNREEFISSGEINKYRKTEFVH